MASSGYLEIRQWIFSWETIALWLPGMNILLFIHVRDSKSIYIPENFYAHFVSEQEFIAQTWNFRLVYKETKTINETHFIWILQLNCGFMGWKFSVINFEATNLWANGFCCLRFMILFYCSKWSIHMMHTTPK